MKLSRQQITTFHRLVWEYYRDHGRELPWRIEPNDYNVVVSELMLQQTQVSRVIPKYQAFLATFPNWETLALAPLSQVLSLWSGLGYNRRAKFLWQTAREVVERFAGTLPSLETELVSLPGIGKNTAGAVRAYAFNESAAFVETNIRTVYFYHFFEGIERVSDTEVLELVGQTLEREHPREWYWALMDYGTYLKSTGFGLLSSSKHYKKQSPLAGSQREMRGRIIKQLVSGSLSEGQLKKRVEVDDRFLPALRDLIKEGLITAQDNVYSLTGTPDAR